MALDATEVTDNEAGETWTKVLGANSTSDTVVGIGTSSDTCPVGKAFKAGKLCYDYEASEREPKIRVPTADNKVLNFTNGVAVLEALKIYGGASPRQV